MENVFLNSETGENRDDNKSALSLFQINVKILSDNKTRSN